MIKIIIVTKEIYRRRTRHETMKYERNQIYVIIFETCRFIITVPTTTTIKTMSET